MFTPPVKVSSNDHSIVSKAIDIEIILVKILSCLWGKNYSIKYFRAKKLLYIGNHMKNERWCCEVEVERDRRPSQGGFGTHPKILFKFLNSERVFRIFSKCMISFNFISLAKL